MTTHAARPAELSIVPACPGPSVPVSVLVKQSPLPPKFVPVDAFVSRTANSFKVLLEVAEFHFPEEVKSLKMVSLGLLPVGDFHVDVYYRSTGPSGEYLPEQPAGSVDFSVDGAALPGSSPCTAGVLSTVEGMFQITSPDAEFPVALAVKVTDGQLRPVPNVSVRFERLPSPEDYFLDGSQMPNAVLSQQETTTDANGIARVKATANAVPGIYQYVAKTTVGDHVPKAFFVLYNRAEVSVVPTPIVPVVEYFNEARAHYFITPYSAELTRLDDGRIAGWERTGGVFLAIAAGQGSNSAGSSPVCRFYGLPQAKLDSHFFSASPAECQAVQQNYPQSWVLETDEAFRSYLPDVVTGDCGPTTVALYRAFNNRVDANHRYSTFQPIVAALETAGWIPEGYGPNAVAMCVPK